MKLKPPENNTWFIVFSILGLFACITVGIILLCGCTITLQNTSSNGKASDLIDDQMDTNPTVSPNISIPLTGV